MVYDSFRYFMGFEPIFKVVTKYFYLTEVTIFCNAVKKFRNE